MKQEFTLDGIEQFLEDMGFRWLDKQVFDYEKNVYERAKMKHFKQPFVYVYLQNENDKKLLVALHANNENFFLMLNNTKVDMSATWREKLKINSQQV